MSLTLMMAVTPAVESIVMVVVVSLAVTIVMLMTITLRILMTFGVFVCPRVHIHIDDSISTTYSTYIIYLMLVQYCLQPWCCLIAFCLTSSSSHRGNLHRQNLYTSCEKHIRYKPGLLKTIPDHQKILLSITFFLYTGSSDEVLHMFQIIEFRFIVEIA